MGTRSRLWFEDQAMMKIVSTPNGHLASLALVGCAELTGQSDYLLRRAWAVR